MKGGHSLPSWPGQQLSVVMQKLLSLHTHIMPKNLGTIKTGCRRLSSSKGAEALSPLLKSMRSSEPCLPEITDSPLMTSSQCPLSSTVCWDKQTPSRVDP